jgi:C-terminal processing protease CtpA/Prc
MSITVRKGDPKEKAGIRLEQESSGRLKVRNIAKNGLFGDTELEIGDVVLSINCVRLSDGEPPEALVEVINKADRNVTIVVRKMNKPQTKPNDKMDRKMKKKQDIKEALTKDNNQAKPDTYYNGISKRNEDGSLNCKKDPEGETKKQRMTVTISGLKEDREDHVGIEFVVQSKKLFVSHVDSNSIFADTDLQVGDCVLSINDMSFREYVDAEYALTICSKAKTQVTLVVVKNEEGFVPVVAGRNAKAPKAKKPSKSMSSGSSTSSRRSRSGSRSERSSHSATKQGKPLCTSSSHSYASSNDEDEFADDDDIAPLKTFRGRKASSKSSAAQARVAAKKHAAYSDDDEDDTAPLSSDDSSIGSAPSQKTGFKIEKYAEKNISVPKAYWKQAIGVEFRTDKKLNMIYVHKIMDGSLFERTSLEEGDYILTINDVCFRSNPDRRHAAKACMQAKESVNLVILKDESSYLETAFNLDQSVTNLDWMVESTRGGLSCPPISP